MALYPPAIKKLIPPGGSDPRIKACGVVLHVRDGLGDSLYDYFNGPSGGVESHFYIRFDGTVEQYRDTGWEADANLDGNSFMRGDVRYGLLSIETEGLAAGKWTPQQMASIKRLLVWASNVHDFPLKLIQSWNGDGVGYHTMWGSPSHWTPVKKSCPGYDRIAQFEDELVPWMEAGGTIDDPWPHIRDKSPAVGKMVEKLAAGGYFNGAHRDAPNYFGKWTKGAIKHLQESFDDTKADPDGVIGPLTWAHIQAIQPDPPDKPGDPVKYPAIQRAQESRAAANVALLAQVASLEVAVRAHPGWTYGAGLLAATKVELTRGRLAWAQLHGINHPKEK